MVIEKGDFVRINYTGRIKESKKVFDTTDEKVAKENNIYNEKINFKASPIVIGASHVIKGLDEALVGSEVGEKKTVEVPPELGYGLRDLKKVKVVPMKDFKKQGLRPVPGLIIESEGKFGKVQSVGSGRVRVDFNYELAGKNLEYEVSVKERINKLEEKIRLLLELNFPFAVPDEHEIKIEGKTALITLADVIKSKREAIVSKHAISRDMFKFLDEITEVHFIEVFKKEPSEEGKGEKKEEEDKGDGKEEEKKDEKNVD